jgi:hypothetical protein
MENGDRAVTQVNPHGLESSEPEGRALIYRAKAEWSRKD